MSSGKKHGPLLMRALIYLASSRPDAMPLIDTPNFEGGLIGQILSIFFNDH